MNPLIEHCNTFAIERKDLVLIYNTASDVTRKFLENKYGKDLFERNIIELVNSPQAACEILGIEYDPPYSNPSNARHEYLNAAYDLDVITEALLEGRKLDWEDSNQRKWYPYFYDFTPGAGFRFVNSFYGWAYTSAIGGARLCVDTKEKSNHLGTHFIDIWNKFLNPNK